MRDWLTRHYGWQAKKTEAIWIAAVVGFFVVVAIVGPVILSAFRSL